MLSPILRNQPAGIKADRNFGARGVVHPDAPSSNVEVTWFLPPSLFASLEDNAVARPAALLSRTEVLARYRHLREISKQHHSAALDFLSKDAVMSQARRLGLAQGKTLVLDSMDDLNLALTLRSIPRQRTARGRLTVMPERHSFRPSLMRDACSMQCATRASRLSASYADTTLLD